jgi:hypothetical protein
MRQFLECLDDQCQGTCEGTIEYREPLSSTGRSFPRCERHWDMRLQTQDEINRRYPDQQPADFDPMYAGERWDEDY